MGCRDRNRMWCSDERANVTRVGGGRYGNRGLLATLAILFWVIYEDMIEHLQET